MELYILVLILIVAGAYITYSSIQRRKDEESSDDISSRISDDFGAISTLKKTQEYVRAKDENGRFIADDPSTPDINEAWVGGKSPAKKSKAKRKTTKKASGKKKTTTKKSSNRKPKQTS